MIVQMLSQKSVVSDDSQLAVGLSLILTKLSVDHMAGKRLKRSARKRKPSNGFRISNGPIVRLPEEKQGSDFSDAMRLPHVPGPPVLFAIGRDPQTIFTYWDIDWASVFANNAPADRQVHLRVHRDDGGEETGAAVEPMAGNYYLPVFQPSGAYRVEIGYYQPQDVWNSVATTDNVTMPPNRVSEDLDIDVATVPFHLSFQRLLDLFRASSSDALIEIIARLQRRSLTGGDRALLSAQEWEILRSMDLSLDELESARRPFNTGEGKTTVRKRAEAILGFGATSPNRGFGQSSWAGAAPTSWH